MGLSDEELQQRERIIAALKASGTRPCCPWCEKPLSAWEMRPRMRLATSAQSNGWGWYVACERCSWDMDGSDVPPIRVLH